MDILPTTLLIDSRVRESTVAKRILSRLPESVHVEERAMRGDPLRKTGNENGVFDDGAHSPLSNAERFSLGKKTLYLTRYDGEWLKSCPGTSGHVCCNLWIVNPGEGCPMDCTYCYLQSYLIRNPTLKIYTNTDEMISAIGDAAEKAPGRLYRVGTGEVIDSLVWDGLTDLSLDLVPFFGERENLVLELKTKSNRVENLLKMPESVHRGKTVVSWSVNAPSVTAKDEALTASLDERITAAEAVVNAGYRVGFHFDPLIHFVGWEDEYNETVSRIFSRIPADRVAWVSLSSLRYQPEMRDVMISRFPESGIPYGEQFLANDKKLRYLQPLRFQMLNFLRSVLKARGPELPVYLCMESPAAWRKVTGGLPAAGAELGEVFSRRGLLNILPG